MTHSPKQDTEILHNPSIIKSVVSKSDAFDREKKILLSPVLTHKGFTRRDKQNQNHPSTCTSEMGRGTPRVSERRHGGFAHKCIVGGTGVETKLA